MSITEKPIGKRESVDAGTGYRVTAKDLRALTDGRPYGFVSYMLAFYGDGGIYDYGMTADEVLEGTVRLLKDYGTGTTFEGDSIDRERVRDIVLEMRESTTHVHKMRPLDDSSGYKCVSCEYQEIRGTTPESEV